jgi:cellulose synthase/poly-beta-1,6-N-acetylglucosamine synthase-like glycosyltransferase
MDSLLITLLIIVYWCCVLEIVYSYAVYPVLLRIAASWFAHPINKPLAYEPSVAVVIPVHNEETVIALKLANIFSSDYDPHKLSVWVGSDCSSDRTDEIVENYGDSRVHLFRAASRSGKAGILNRIVPLAQAEIILFTDADIMFDRSSIRLLVRNFADPHVGGVAGVTIQRKKGVAISNEETSYRHHEARQKAYEALLHSTISAFGSFYAVQKRLFVPFHPYTYSNDDVMLPMNVIRQGYRMYFEKEAISYEEAQEDIAVEFKRRVRICAGNFQALFWLLDFLNPLRGWPFFCFVSHKVSRWFSPVALAFGIVCCGILALATDLLLYKIFFSLGLIAIAAGLLHKIIPLRLCRAFFYFCAMNVAALMGLWRFLCGIRSAAWSRTERVEKKQ